MRHGRHRPPPPNASPAACRAGRRCLGVRKGSVRRRRPRCPRPRCCAVAHAYGAVPAPRPQGHGVRPCSTTSALLVPPQTPPPRPPSPHATDWMPSWTAPETGHVCVSDALVTIDRGVNAPVHPLLPVLGTAKLRQHLFRSVRDDRFHSEAYEELDVLRLVHGSDVH